MRKHLIGTILVLAALAACNKEVDTLTPATVDPVEETPAGKVTLTFKATIGEETRTVYANDKTASWAAGDAISVCVTDGKNHFEVVDFTTANGTDFTGEVSDGYTTIVSGIYPANPVYKGESMGTYFGSNGSVIKVNLPATYELGTANDTGRFIPMVGEMVHDNDNDTDTFTFHHICGALKITVVDIFNALTFTTNAEVITGDFLLSGNSISTTANSGTSTVTFNYDRLPREEGHVGERENRTFYIPVPFVTLTAGATMALKNSSDKVVFEKTTSGNIAFDSKVIKRFTALALDKKTSNSWRITVSSANPGEKGSHSHYVPSGTLYIQAFMPIETFNDDYHGSVAEYIESKGLTNTIYDKSLKFTLNKNIDQYFGKTYIGLTCEVTNDGERRVAFQYSQSTYVFEDPASSDYSYWLGEWNVYDNVSTTPKQDHWTIERSITNSSYLVKGVFNGTYDTAVIECEALLEGSAMKFLSQKVRETSNYKYFLLGSTNQAADRIEGEGNDIMLAQKDDDNSAFLYPIDPVKRYYLIAYKVSDGSFYSQYGYRFLTSPAPMTRVTE